MIRSIKRLVHKMDELKALEEKVNKLEFVFGSGAEDIVRKAQMEMLQDLYRLRDALKEDLKEIGAPPASDTAPLLAEIKKLQEENSKLNYRINHLKRYID